VEPEVFAILSYEELQVFVEYHNRKNTKLNFREIVAHIRCGTRSNIPICCMIFFSCIWEPCSMLTHFHIFKRFKEWYFHLSGGFNYIPCPFCILIDKPRVLYKCSGQEYGCCYNR